MCVCWRGGEDHTITGFGINVTTQHMHLCVQKRPAGCQNLDSFHSSQGVLDSVSAWFYNIYV